MSQEKDPKSSPKPQEKKKRKRSKWAKFEDVLCMYKYIKHLFAEIEELKERIKKLEEQNKVKAV